MPCIEARHARLSQLPSYRTGARRHEPDRAGSPARRARWPENHTAYSDGSGIQLLTGAPSPAEPLITFTPLPAPQPDRRLMESFTLTVIDPDHFTWVPLDRGWRAVFTREP